MTKTLGEWIFEDGLNEGYRRGLLQVVLAYLQARFGPLSAPAVEKLKMVPFEEVDRFADVAFLSPSLSDLGLDK